MPNSRLVGRGVRKGQYGTAYRCATILARSSCIRKALSEAPLE